MQYAIEGGSLPVAILYLEPGETVISESGGRTWSRGDIVTETSSGGGLGKMLGRSLTGESMFMSKYTAQSKAEIAFASSFPGQIIARELGPGESVIAQKKAFMCGVGVTLSTHMQKKMGAGLVGGEGFIMQKITGPGIVFLEIDGYAKGYQLQPGERIVADTGVLAVMDETCDMSVERVKGVKNVLFGGEGLFDTVITGPGQVYLQTMSVTSLAGVLAGPLQAILGKK